MTRYVHTDVLDGGLNAIKTGATKMLLIDSYSFGDNYATVVGNKLAEVAMSSGDFTISSSGNNRVIATTSKTAVATAANPTPDLHIAFTDGSSKVLWVADDVQSIAIDIGNTITFPSVTYVQRQPGPLGQNGLDGNTIITVDAPPSNMVGKDGDYALDVAAQLIYGPKDTTWPAGVSIKGATGDGAIALSTINNASGTVILDCTKNFFNVTQTGNITTFDFSNVPAATVLTIIVNRTGSYTQDWPSNVIWQDGVKPSPSTVTGLKDVYTLITATAGSPWIGSVFAEGVS